MNDDDEPENWVFIVATSEHDMVKVGVIEQVVSQVIISRAEYPNWVYASETAAVLAAVIHGGMPTRVTGPVI